MNVGDFSRHHTRRVAVFAAVRAAPVHSHTRPGSREDRPADPPCRLHVQGQDAGCFHPKADIRTEAETQSTDSEDRQFYSITLVATPRFAERLLWNIWGALITPP